MFAAHSWPRRGNKQIQEVMRTQRDTYANLNSGVLRRAHPTVARTPFATPSFGEKEKTRRKQG